MATPASTQEPPAAPSAATRPDRGWLWSLVAGLVILGLIALVPLGGDPSDLHTWTLIVMYAVLAQGWNFIGGFTGYAAFGNVVFFGIGAYSVGIALNGGKPFLFGLAIGLVLALLFALLVGLPVLRLRGHYFAIATLGVAEAVRELVTARDIGGSGGLVSLFPPSLDALPLFLYGFVALSALTLLGTAWLSRSRFGYALVAVRENEQAAEALGISTYWYKVGAFALSAIPTAIAGGMYAYWATGFDPETVFDVGISVEMVLLTFIGGTGTILGPLLGGILFEYISTQIQFSGATQHNSVLGLAVLVVAIFLPQGLLRLLREFAPRRGAPREVPARLREGVRRVGRYLASNGV